VISPHASHAPPEEAAPENDSFWIRLNRRLNHDFCPGLNRWVYWMKHPLAVLALATGAAIVCAVLLAPQAWIVAGTLLGVTLLGMAWPWLAIGGVECGLEFRRSRVRPGESVTVTLRIRNRRPWPVWGLSLAGGFGGAGGTDAAVALSRLGGWTTEEFDWDFQPAARGVYPLEPPRIETSFPFGLLARGKPVSDYGELIVWPREVLLESLPDTSRFNDRGELFSDRRAGDFGDMLGTRLFRAGDSLRRVHWAQTARQGTLIVTERQTPIRSAVRIVADLPARDDAAGPEFAGDSLELTLSLMASLCTSLVAQHCHVECLLAGRAFTPSRSLSELNEFRDALARVSSLGFDAGAQAPRPLRGRRRGQGEMFEIEIRSGGSALDRPAGGRRARDRRVIVLGDAVPACARADRPWVELPLRDDALDLLPRQWRRACRAG
jgi:uncharacterized protein (DUF58 family)